MLCIIMKKVEFGLKVKKYGNSLVIVIPKGIVDAMQVETGDIVDVSVREKHVMQN